MPLKPTSFTESPTPPPMAGRPRRKASELAARKIQLDLGLDRRCPDSYRIDAIASDRVTWGEEFGRGTSAVIHRGSWRKGRRANPKAVALKWLKHAGREYDAEAKLLKQVLSQFMEKMAKSEESFDNYVKRNNLHVAEMEDLFAKKAAGAEDLRKQLREKQQQCRCGCGSFG